MNIKDILEENGYSVSDFGSYYKTSANWRGGNDTNSVTIYKDGACIDHVTGEKFNYKTLICKILGFEDPDRLNDYLEKSGAINTGNSQRILEPLIKVEKIINENFINALDKSDKAQEYWLKRKIPLNILNEFGGGTYKTRYYFPIRNFDKKLVGWQSRDLTGKDEKKYKIRGEKKNFLCPAFCLDEITKSKKVYLHEGIPDVMSAMSVGVRNNLIQFGTEISFTIVNFLLKISDVEIVICQNNDDAGRNSSIKIRKKLCKYFDWSQVKTREVPTPFKDLNDILLKGSQDVLKKWFETT